MARRNPPPQDIVQSHVLRDRLRNEVQKSVLLREVSKIRQQRMASLQDDLRQLTQSIEESSRKRPAQGSRPARRKRTAS